MAVALVRGTGIQGRLLWIRIYWLTWPLLLRACSISSGVPGSAPPWFGYNSLCSSSIWISICDVVVIILVAIICGSSNHEFCQFWDHLQQSTTTRRKGRMSTGQLLLWWVWLAAVVWLLLKTKYCSLWQLWSNYFDLQQHQTQTATAFPLHYKL
jgi:hypothetical protein